MAEEGFGRLGRLGVGGGYEREARKLRPERAVARWKDSKLGRRPALQACSKELVRI
jgi:hypothetical protein